LNNRNNEYKTVNKVTKGELYKPEISEDLFLFFFYSGHPHFHSKRNGNTKHQKMFKEQEQERERPKAQEGRPPRPQTALDHQLKR
jgi:hypothetical protein